MFARVFVFSPSIFVDDSHRPLRAYLDKMSPDQKKEPLYFEDLHQAVLGRIIDEQRAIVEYCKKNKTQAPHILIMVDDMADRPDVLNRRQSGKNAGGSFMTSLAVRGRHCNISWLVTTMFEYGRFTHPQERAKYPGLAGQIYRRNRLHLRRIGCGVRQGNTPPAVPHRRERRTLQLAHSKIRLQRPQRHVLASLHGSSYPRRSFHRRKRCRTRGRQPARN